MSQIVTRLSSIQRQRALSQLKSAALFEGLTQAVLEGLVSRMQLVILSDSEVLFRQRDPADNLFLLSTGQIKLLRSSNSGNEKIISLVQAGSTFAEAVMFSTTKVYPVSAVAVGDSSVWAINGAHYVGVLQHSTDACLASIKLLTERLHRHVAEIERLTLHTASSRLIAYLLAQVPDGTIANEASIRLESPKNVIASRLSIVPATFSRSLSRLSREGLLDVCEDDIVLLDIARLREYTDEVVV